MDSDLTYHNDPAVKAHHVALCESHRRADKLVAGRYEGARACSVGCLTRSYRIPDRSDHAALAAKVGLPEWLVYVQDTVFEGLPEADRADWHVDLAEAIPVGVDLKRVLRTWLRWLLADPTHGCRRYATGDALAAVDRVVALIDRWLAGDVPADIEWAAARAVAWATAAESAAAATAAAESAAASWASAAATWAARASAATWAATWAAEASAAERAARASAATVAERRAFFRASADELLRLLREATRGQ